MGALNPLTNEITLKDFEELRRRDQKRLTDWIAHENYLIGKLICYYKMQKEQSGNHNNHNNHE